MQTDESQRSGKIETIIIFDWTEVFLRSKLQSIGQLPRSAAPVFGPG